MERLYPSRKFGFNKEIDNWKSITQKALDDACGILYLIDLDTGEYFDATILFLYSTLIYTGYKCQGILKIGNEIGTAFISLTVCDESVSFITDSNLNNKNDFDEKVQKIIEDLDDDCLNSEAIHVQNHYCVNTMVK